MVLWNSKTNVLFKDLIMIVEICWKTIHPRQSLCKKTTDRISITGQSTYTLSSWTVKFQLLKVKFLSKSSVSSSNRVGFGSLVVSHYSPGGISLSTSIYGDINHRLYCLIGVQDTNWRCPARNTIFCEKLGERNIRNASVFDPNHSNLI